MYKASMEIYSLKISMETSCSHFSYFPLDSRWGSPTPNKSFTRRFSSRLATPTNRRLSHLVRLLHLLLLLLLFESSLFFLVQKQNRQIERQRA